MTMEMNRDFSLIEDFTWDAPINAMVQQSIAAYGSDEDRIRLANHFSVSVDSLIVMSLVPSAEVKLAVIQHESTPANALLLLTHDENRFIRRAAKAALAMHPAGVSSIG